MKKIFIILLITGGVVLVLTLFLRTKPAFLIPTALPTPTPVLPERAIAPIPTISNLEQAVVNQTTEQQVRQIPNITASGSAQEENIYTLPSVNPLIPDEIRTKNGIVVFERTSTFTSNPGGLPSMQKRMAQLGQPDKIIDGNAIYGPTASLVVFAGKGVALVGNIHTDETYEIQQFAPTTLLEYLRKYGNIVQSEEPQDRFQL